MLWITRCHLWGKVAILCTGFCGRRGFAGLSGGRGWGIPVSVTQCSVGIDPQTAQVPAADALSQCPLADTLARGEHLLSVPVFSCPDESGSDGFLPWPCPRPGKLPAIDRSRAMAVPQPAYRLHGRGHVGGPVPDGRHLCVVTERPDYASGSLLTFRGVGLRPHHPHLRRPFSFCRRAPPAGPIPREAKTAKRNGRRRR